MQPISNSFLRKDVRNQILSGDQDIKLRERDIALKTRRLLVKLADLASLKSVLISPCYKFYIYFFLCFSPFQVL